MPLVKPTKDGSSKKKLLLLVRQQLPLLGRIIALGLDFLGSMLEILGESYLILAVYNWIKDQTYTQLP